MVFFSLLKKLTVSKGQKIYIYSKKLRVDMVNEFIQENIILCFSVGAISTIFVFLVLIVGVVRLLMFFLVRKKEAITAYFFLANLFLLISLVFVVYFFTVFFTAGAGSVSGLMIPMVMPLPAIFCILYVIFSIKSVRKGKFHSS